MNGKKVYKIFGQIGGTRKSYISSRKKSNFVKQILHPKIATSKSRQGADIFTIDVKKALICDKMSCINGGDQRYVGYQLQLSAKYLR